MTWRVHPTKLCACIPSIYCLFFSFQSNSSKQSGIHWTITNFQLKGCRGRLQNDCRVEFTTGGNGRSIEQIRMKNVAWCWWRNVPDDKTNKQLFFVTILEFFIHLALSYRTYGHVSSVGFLQSIYPVWDHQMMLSKLLKDFCFVVQENNTSEARKIRCDVTFQVTSNKTSSLHFSVHFTSYHICTFCFFVVFFFTVRWIETKTKNRTFLIWTSQSALKKFALENDVMRISPL